MLNSSKGRFAIGIVGVLAVAGLVILWALRQGQLPTVPTAITQPPKQAAAAPVAVAPKPQTTGGDTTGAPAPDNEKDAVNPPVVDNTPAEAPAPKTWEDHLDDILLSDDDNNVKADQVLGLLATTPPEHQEELAQHLVNLVQDDHYDATSNLLMNVNTSTNVSDILMNDLLNRNNTLKLNTLLAVLKTPDHPMHDNAKEMLELFVQEDHGTNYDEWSQAVANWLKENEPPPDQAQATDPNAPAAQ